MRTFELLLVLLCAGVSIRFASIGRITGLVLGAQCLLVALLIAQVVIEGWRWQMFPAYAAVLLTVAVTPNLLGVGGQTLFGSVMATVALVAASVVSCLALPFVEPPPPRGTFQAGVMTIPVSASRSPDAVEEEMKGTPSVRLWYPASWVGIPAETFLERRRSDRFRAVPTNRAIPDAPVAPAPQSTGFPVVIYFDGWPEDRIQNVNLIVELVSHGFAVAAVQYPAKLDTTSDAADARLRAQMARDMVDYSSDAGFGRSVELDHRRARLHAQDAIAVLDTLAAISSDNSSTFAGRLDTQHAGALGFSFGGAVAGVASHLDSRIQAAANLDGRHWDDALYKGVERPYLLVGGQMSLPPAAALTSHNAMIRYEALLDQVDYVNLEAHLRALGGFHVSIAGTEHPNFNDSALRSPLRRLSHGGTIDARRAGVIIQTYVVEFFTRYLQAAQPSAPEHPWPQFSDARLEIWPAPKASQ
jgi:dienelactone hydrolase